MGQVVKLFQLRQQRSIVSPKKSLAGTSEEENNARLRGKRTHAKKRQAQRQQQRAAPYAGLRHQRSLGPLPRFLPHPPRSLPPPPSGLRFFCSLGLSCGHCASCGVSAVTQGWVSVDRCWMHRLSLFSFVGSRLEAKVRKRANEACVEFLRVVDVEFLEATRAEEHCLATPSDAGASTPCALDDLVDYGTRRAEAALQRIGAKSGALPFSTKDASGYCIDFLRRKLVAARLLQQNLHECDWSTVDKASLQGMSADAKANLEEITDTWRASEISSFFTGRADWGLFASVFPCLWGEVADKLSTEDDRARALALVKSKDFLRVVQSFRRSEGIAPHPAVAYGIAVAEEKKQSKRAMVSPRASTPRKKRV